MKIFLIFLCFLFACTQPKRTPDQMIIGKWMYLSVDSLEDGTKTDSAGMADFNAHYAGSSITFYPDGTILHIRKENGRDSVVQQSRYWLSPKGDSILVGDLNLTAESKTKAIKSLISDSILKGWTDKHTIVVYKKVQ